MQPRGPLAWTVAPESLARVDDRGLLSALVPGTVTLQVTTQDSAVSREVVIIHEVATFGWEPVSAEVSVGDTAWLRAVARDSVGREIASVPLSGLTMGSDVLLNARWVDGRGVWVVGRRSGIVTVTAVLGSRRAEAEVIIR